VVVQEPGIDGALSDEGIGPWEDKKSGAINHGGKIHSEAQKHRRVKGNQEKYSPCENIWRHQERRISQWNEE